MRLGIIVTEFPKTTETFILRDLVEFHRLGHDIRIYHLTRFRKGEVVHDFARHALSWARSMPYFFGRKVLAATLSALLFKPKQTFKIIRDLLRGFCKEPVWLAKSLLLVPKSCAIADELNEWQVDHVHAEFATHPATTAWIVRRLTGIPYSVSCHAHDIFLTLAMLRWKMGEASFVRSISKFNRDYLLRHIPELKDTPIEIIHVGVDTAKTPVLEPPRSDTLRILYVGSLEIRKGVKYLLNALALLDKTDIRWECHILGGGPESVALEHLSKESKLTDMVTFYGPQPFEEVAKQLPKASVMVVPSIIGPGGRTEGIPTVLVEALSHQRPVIATRVSGVPELVIEGDTGWLVEPKDEHSIFKALKAVAESPEEAHRRARNGRIKVEKEFDLHNIVAAQLQQFARYRHQ